MSKNVKIFKATIISNDSDLIKNLKHIIHKNCPEIDFALSDKYDDASYREILLFNPNVIFIDIDKNATKSETYIDRKSEKFIEDLHKNFKLIIISNCQKYAMKAISYGVMGYLIKPLKLVDVIPVLDRLKELCMKETGGYAPDPKSFNSDIIAISSLSKIEIINCDEIMFLKASGRYTYVELINGKSIIASKNLGEFEKILEGKFFRTHHSFMVNINHVKNINKAGGYYMELKSGNTVIPIAKRRLDVFNKYLRLK